MYKHHYKPTENSVEMEGDSSIIEAPWKQPNMIMEEKLDLIVFG